MKSFIYMLIAIMGIGIGSLNAQVADITEINEALTERPWLDNSVHDLYGHEIMQVFGEREAMQRHSNLGPITNVAYLDQEQLISRVDGMNIPTTKKKTLVQKYNDEAKGGAVQLFISRDTESRANFKWYFIVIRGADDKEKIMEIDLEYQASQLPEGNGWWNYTTVLLPDPLEFPFYIYVNDRQSQYLSDFKFKISK